MSSGTTTPTSTTSARPVRHPAGGAWAEAVPHSPGLDGVRGIAVLAVLAYHLDLGWAGGGFLGVEVFFTLSGFLITQLLTAELRRRGRVDAGAFLRARSRRLLPALVACVLATVVVFRVFAPDTVPDLRGDAVASLLYLQNWHLVVAGVPYSEAFAQPSPLLHLWSLAVEGQLYLLWPLLFVGGLAYLRPRLTTAVTLLLAVGSAVVIALRYVPDGGDELVYYATDGRASGFLVGAALALVWRPSSWRAPMLARMRVALDLAGGISLVALLVAFVTTSEFDGALYQTGGFLRTGLLTAVVMAAATRPDGVLSRLVGRRVLVWTGQRSYGLYLYHWPVFVLLRDLPWPSPLRDLLALATTVMVTEVSYRFLEVPVRRGGIRRLVARMRISRPTLTVLSTAGVAVLATVTVACTSAAPPPAVETLASTPDTSPVAPEPSPVAPPAPTTPPAPSTTPAARAGDPVLVVGDSIVLGSIDALRATLPPGSRIDGRVGRQFAAAPSIVSRWTAANPGAVVVDLGANGTVEQSDVDAVLAATGNRRVVLVGTEVDRRWRDDNNSVLRSSAARDPRITFVDWEATVEGRPGVLGSDGVHPGPQGRTLLADTVAAALRG